MTLVVVAVCPTLIIAVGPCITGTLSRTNDQSSIRLDYGCPRWCRRNSRPDGLIRSGVSATDKSMLIGCGRRCEGSLGVVSALECHLPRVAAFFSPGVQSIP